MSATASPSTIRSSATMSTTSRGRRTDVRLTDPAFLHTITPAPDGAHFVDVAQTHDTPPVTRLIDSDGRILAELAKSDTTKFDQLGLKKVEMFTYMAADGKTALHGL